MPLTYPISSFMSSFSELEKAVESDLQAILHPSWMDFREPVNELAHLQHSVMRQLEGRWFLRSSYQESLAEISELARRALSLAQGIRIDVTEEHRNTPEFDALAAHAIAFVQRISEQPERLLQLRAALVEVRTVNDLTL